MTDAYNPSITDGQVMAKVELDRIATASAALEVRIANIEGRMAYGGMRMEIGSAHDISLSPTPVSIAAWDTLSPATGVSQSLADGELTIATAGVYLFDSLVGLSGTADNTTYSLEARLNNQPAGSIPGDAPEKKTDRILLGIQSMPVAFAGGDVVSLFLSADVAGSVEIDRAMMRLYRIG